MKNLIAITAIVALTTSSTLVTAKDNNKHNNLQEYRRNKQQLHEYKKQLRRAQVQHVNTSSNTPQHMRRRKLRKNSNNGIAVDNSESSIGLEEDVEFFTNLNYRKLQGMSIPMTNPPNPSPIIPPPTPGTAPPVPVITEPPVLTPPTAVDTPPPVPVSGVVCAAGETCTTPGEICSDGTKDTCCDGSELDAFQCTCGTNGLFGNCGKTNGCNDITCGGDTPSPTPAQAGFNCPAASFVGCTAPDPQDFADECPTVGEPCPQGNAGEFCCRDACPRNYCTAKQAPAVKKSGFLSDLLTELELPIELELPMDVAAAIPKFEVPLDFGMDETLEALSALEEEDIPLKMSLP